MRASLPVLLGLAVLATAGAPLRARAQGAAPSGAIWARVLGTDSLPLEGAEIVLPTMGLSLRTPAGGAILLTGVPEGLYILQARHLGYAPAWQTLRVARDTALVQLALGAAAQMLDTVSITEVAPVARRLMDFDRRRRASGFGKFLTQEDVERIRPVDMAALLRHVSGIEVRTGPSGASVQSRRTMAHSTCSGMLVFLDGVLVAGQEASGAVRLPQLGAGTRSARDTPPANPPTRPPTSPHANPPAAGTPLPGAPPGSTPPPTRGPQRTPAANAVISQDEPNWGALAARSAAGRAPGFDLNAIPVRLIAGIEVYPSGAGIPAQYASYRGAECGVMLIWTAG